LSFADSGAGDIAARVAYSEESVMSEMHEDLILHRAKAVRQARTDMMRALQTRANHDAALDCTAFGGA